MVIRSWCSCPWPTSVRWQQRTSQVSHDAASRGVLASMGWRVFGSPQSSFSLLYCQKRETFDKLLLCICSECCFRLPREPFACLATSSSRNDRQTQARLLSLLCGLGESFPCIGALDTSLRAFEPCIGLPKFRFCCLLRIWKGLGPANPSTSVTLAPFKLLLGCLSGCKERASQS
jgi:hypothetical protein